MPRHSRSNKRLVPLAPDAATPLDLHTPSHGNMLAMMVTSGRRDEQPYLHGEAVEKDHVIAASLPVERSVVAENGHMDHHRKPIVSIHGKDVDEHELGHRDVA